ncbi:MAG: DMT family transporter [Flavobacteriaceae bacterium]|nr:DMT family transporter [Flavobacteriaceae bacterium]
MNNRNFALLAAFIATSIYGINHTVGKELMPQYIGAYGLILLRVLGASIVFWLIGIGGPKEKIEKKDWKRFVLCAFVGMSINMLAFFKGLSLSTPINSSIIITIAPIMVFVMSVIFLKEKITTQKYIGVSIGFIGALSLILFSNEVSHNAPNITLGNILFVVNCMFYGVYLILVKPLTKKYHSFTIMKWLFLLAVFINLPVTIGEFTQVEWLSLPFDAIWRMVFVVVGTTFLTYLLNVYALRELKASTIGVFMYVQPIIGIIYAVIIGNYSLNSLKVIATALIFSGVYLVSKKNTTNRA